MARLKDRQKQIPNGYQFYLTEAKWQAPSNFPSFTTVCNGLEAVIRANPFLAQKNGWPTDRAKIEDWVDLYNAKVCQAMGWDAYITTEGGASLPKSSPQHQQQILQSLRNAAATAKALVAGAKSLMEWEDSGEPAVSAEQSLARAIVCTACPLNEKGDYTRWFTTGAAELIKRRVEKAQARKLTTPRDELLNICTACHCPLKLKVHVPLPWIVNRLSEDQKSKLDSKCWILHES
jgi:hypothetical protein